MSPPGNPVFRPRRGWKRRPRRARGLWAWNASRPSGAPSCWSGW